MTDSKPYEQAEEVASLRKQKAELLEALMLVAPLAEASVRVFGRRWVGADGEKVNAGVRVDRARAAIRNAGSQQ